MLETEWVLRPCYGYTPEQFAAFVEWLDVYAQVDLVQAPIMRKALTRHRTGMDFADALHLAQADGEPFLTLDKTLQRKAGSLGLRTEALI
jgi:predicted nucleic acid-binding protein